MELKKKKKKNNKTINNKIKTKEHKAQSTKHKTYTKKHLPKSKSKRRRRWKRTKKESKRIEETTELIDAASSAHKRARRTRQGVSKTSTRGHQWIAEERSESREMQTANGRANGKKREKTKRMLQKAKQTPTVGLEPTTTRLRVVRSTD